MADLIIGEKVRIIKNLPGQTFDFVGYEGIVDRRVSGGWAIKVRIGMFGDQELTVGSIDWHEYVKKLVNVAETPSAVPKSLVAWYKQTTLTIKKGV